MPNERTNELPQISAQYRPSSNLWIATNPRNEIVAIASDLDLLSVCVSDAYRVPEGTFEGFDLIVLPDGSF